MDLAADKRSDLTTTIHLTSLRSVESNATTLLEQAGSELLEVLARLAPDSAMLVSLIGPNRGARFLLDQAETMIGRAPENEIFLDDVTVSRRHANIRKESRGGKTTYHLSDLGSLNGTYINGVISKDHQLADGDEVQIGKFRMHFFSGKVNK